MKKNENFRKNEESETLAHSGLWGWIRPCRAVFNKEAHLKFTFLSDSLCGEYGFPLSDTSFLSKSLNFKNFRATFKGPHKKKYGTYF